MHLRESRRPTPGDDARLRGTRTWHARTAAAAAVALLTQPVIGVAEVPGRGFVPDPAASGTVARRVVSLFSFFTVQSNVLVCIAALAPARRDHWARWVHLAALVRISAAFTVTVAVLRPATGNRYEGIWVVTDFALHSLMPGLHAGSWLVVGPRPHVRPRLVGEVMSWPALWVADTFIRGAIIGWYPYRFLDVDTHWYRFALAGVAIVAALGLAIGGLFVWLDRRLPPRFG